LFRLWFICLFVIYFKTLNI